MLSRSRLNHPPGLSKGNIVAWTCCQVPIHNRISFLCVAARAGGAPPMAGGQYKSIEGSETGQPNMEVLSDSFYCVLQLGFNNNLDGLANACIHWHFLFHYGSPSLQSRHYHSLSP
ncbi:hypothetical protein ARMGADRAFT_286142 [Armillaria gallica]|uniref:Uncharacterized protein n=1 Tax=Armillaria gallica TaxID=47427 RepID=A0A2H3DB92_ARMGA|nr:hypothetical protein ARMGADRAFT_286142 [Armillaria gallica]